MKHVMAVVLCTVAAAPALADEERERRLEERVGQLERELADVRSRMASGGPTELEQRVAELETLAGRDAHGLAGVWDAGLRFRNPEGGFLVRVGGRVQNDWAFFDSRDELEEVVGEMNSGTEFRRVRLHVAGTIYRNVEFSAELDFAGGSAKARDLNIALTDVACSGVTLRVGSMKEPFGLEELTSDLFTTFIERSTGNEAFVPSYNTGAALFRTFADDRVFAGAGVFRDSNEFGDDVGNAEQGEWNFTGRVAGRPWVDSDGANYLHLGLGLSHREASDGAVQFRSRPEAHIAPRFVDTGVLAIDGFDLANLEAVLGLGPVSLQGEYFVADVDGAAGADPRFDAWYLQASWFVTGEARAYDAKRAVFGRMKPAKNHDDAGGWGAWEVAARFSTIDLEDEVVDGGRLDDWTLGLNWYLNPNTKVMLNLVRARRDGVGAANIVQMRFQVDF